MDNGHSHPDGARESDLVRTFLALIDAGSLSAAARQLGSSQPTVGRHVARFV